MKHIKTIETRNLCESAKKGGCGECQTSCQSACKTSCGIANQQCESTKESKESKKFARNKNAAKRRHFLWDERNFKLLFNGGFGREDSIFDTPCRERRPRRS